MPMIDIYATEGERHGGKTHGRAFVASRVISIGPARASPAQSLPATPIRRWSWS